MSKHAIEKADRDLKSSKKPAPTASEPARKGEAKKTRSDPGCRLSPERQEINSYLQKLRFRKRFFGVDEQDLWKKLAELNALYEQELRAERIRYDTLLAEYKQKTENGNVSPTPENTPPSLWEDSHEP